MKDRLNSIRFRSWLTFVLFSLIVIVFLYFFQVVLLSSYYEYMKIQETASAAKQIKDAWSQQPENLNSIVSDIADKQKIYIEISDSNRPYFRASSLDKSNKEVYSLITSLSPNDMKEIISGENTFFTATIPRTNNDSKAIVLIAQLDDGTESTFFKTNGIVRLYIFNYLEPLGTTTAILHSQLNLTAGIIIIVAFIMSIIFSNSISKPIINISKAALKLPQGQFDMPVKKNSFTEINELTDTLSSASVEIAKADTLRKDLMANISHDLRTPLTMIAGYSEAMRDIPGEMTPENMQIVIDETRRLTSLVNDVLDLSRITSGTLALRNERFSLTELCGSAMERYAHLNEKDGYDIRFVHSSEVYVFADRTRVLQVLYNLVNNAVNYTGDDKRVTVTQEIRGDAVRISVTDTGEGIPEEKLPLIWERYYKASEYHRRGEVGSGLGLSIVKGILDGYGAHYGVTSKLGCGSTFWFELPISDSPEHGNAAAPDDGLK